MQRTAQIEVCPAISRSFFARQIIFQSLSRLGIASQVEERTGSKKARIDIAAHNLIERSKRLIKAPLFKGRAALDTQQDLALWIKLGMMGKT